jgi:hypothetical protein
MTNIKEELPLVIMSALAGGVATCLLILLCMSLFDIDKEIAPVSERLDACEEKGGRYTLYYSDYSEEYSEHCEIQERYIEDF